MAKTRRTPISDEATDPLIDLGFTSLEASIYVFLLQESPATGYRVAQAVGKAAANVYKALETLERKGAVVIDEGRTRACRAVPAAELLSNLQTRFARSRAEAERQLERLAVESRDDRVYQLRTAEQVLQRAREMLARSSEFALIDAFPEPLELLTPDIEAAAERGVDVAVLAYRAVELEGADVTLAPADRAFLDLWPGQQLSIVVDGGEFLQAMLSRDGTRVLQAIWSQSPFLACFLHDGVVSGLIATALEVGLAAGLTAEALRERREHYRRLTMPATPGFRALAARHGPPTESLEKDAQDEESNDRPADAP